MRNIISILLFNFIIFLNYDELWAADLPDHQMPPPGPNRFARYPNGHVLYQNRRMVGAVMRGRLVTIAELTGQATREERADLEVSHFLPDEAEVFRQPKGRIGFLFDKRINGPDEKGEVRVLAPQNGDIVISSGRAIAKYDNGWKEFKLH